jgi:hypothetical protein
VDRLTEFLLCRGEGQLAAALFVLLLLATELGFRLGRHVAPKLSVADRAQATTIEAAVIGLVGLLLAFAFGAAGVRFDGVKNAVGAEARALDSAWRTAASIDEPLRSQLRSALLDYVDARIDLSRDLAANDRAAVLVDVARARQLESRTAPIATEVLRRAPGDARSVLLVGSIDAVLGANTTLVQAARGWLPAAILLLLALATAAALVMVGYAKGLAGRRTPFSSTILTVLTVAIVIVVVDMDRPLRGVIRVPRQSLIELRERFAAT